jgi:hypothetical protein
LIKANPPGLVAGLEKGSSGLNIPVPDRLPLCLNHGEGFATPVMLNQLTEIVDGLMDLEESLGHL